MIKDWMMPRVIGPAGPVPGRKPPLALPPPNDFKADSPWTPYETTHTLYCCSTLSILRRSSRVMKVNRSSEPLTRRHFQLKSKFERKKLILIYLYFFRANFYLLKSVWSR